jgi:phosphoserine phosphatase RsbU/P
VVRAFSDAAFDATELTLRPGDRFFLYSDGLIETGGTGEEGIQRLTLACGASRGASLENMISSLLREVTAGAAVQDDIVLKGVEV